MEKRKKSEKGEELKMTARIMYLSAYSGEQQKFLERWYSICGNMLQMIPILIVVAILIFTLMYFVPGDPIQILLGDTATPVQIQETRERLGLDYPYIVRLKNFMVDLCHLDFGESYITGADVGRELLGRFPNTLILAFFCVAVSLIFGIPIGIHCALRADKLPDRIWLFFTMLCSSMAGADARALVFAASGDSPV